MSLYTTYAETSDLATYLAVDISALPTNATRLLQRASELVQQITAEILDDTNDDHLEAAQLATCAQVEYWISMSEAASISGNIQSFSLGDLSMTMGSNNSGPNTICPRAVAYLNQQGLLYRGLLNHRKYDIYGDPI